MLATEQIKNTTSPKAVDANDPVFAVAVDVPKFNCPGFADKNFAPAAVFIFIKAIMLPTAAVEGIVSVSKPALLQK